MAAACGVMVEGVGPGWCCRYVGSLHIPDISLHICLDSIVCLIVILYPKSFPSFMSLLSMLLGTDQLALCLNT